MTRFDINYVVGVVNVAKKRWYNNQPGKDVSGRIDGKEPLVFRRKKMRFQFKDSIIIINMRKLKTGRKREVGRLGQWSRALDVNGAGSTPVSGWRCVEI